VLIKLRSAQVQGATAFFSHETFAEIGKQVSAYNNTVNLDKSQLDPPAVSRDYEGIHGRIIRIRSHLSFATATWSNIHGQCIKIKDALEPLSDEPTDNPEVINACIEGSNTVVLFLSTVLVDYAMGIRSIKWKLWWLSKAEGDEIIRR
jgi:hypothetical protein